MNKQNFVKCAACGLESIIDRPSILSVTFDSGEMKQRCVFSTEDFSGSCKHLQEAIFAAMLSIRKA